MPEEATPALQIIESEIRTCGPITFARFMEIALYGEHGYYSNSAKPGSDYATSPQMHPAFGTLIAGWLFKAWEALGEPEVFDVVEIGAGDGGLARDILDAFEVTRYRAFDRKPRPSINSVAVNSSDELSDLDPIIGCVISNELLDAFPCHVFTIRDGAVLESYVSLVGDGELVFLDGEVSSVEIKKRVAPFVRELPDGYRGEVNLGIDDWASGVAKFLKRGYLLTIDYGSERGGLYHPERSEGSLRCYRDHVLGQNPFRDVGLQDITAHVDFTAVDEALTQFGFERMVPLLDQRGFLFDLGFGEYIQQVRRQLAQTRDGSDTYQLMTEMRSMNALVDTRGLGSFKVAQYGVDAMAMDLAGLESSPLFARPVRSPRHVVHLPYD
ncbi:MAG: hypothetical protein F4X40_07435 [Chloroflexi bacterium]|nr:hypothetical protein [Chloroflexota bacterium]